MKARTIITHLIIQCLLWQELFCAKLNSLHKLENHKTFNDKNEPEYKIGFGIGDITGPSAEINMMGYARLGQDTRGIHTRLYSRAVIIADQSGTKICYVNVDLAAVTQIIKILVLQQLETIFGKDVFGHENVMIGATHTHSGPGGYFQYLLYIITQEGFIKESLNAIVTGVVKSIREAHNNLKPGYIYYNEDLLLGANINRSPASYLQNPLEERAEYKYDTDKMMQILQFKDASGEAMGLMSWYPVHATSMNHSNKLISGDNKGYAAIRFEEDFNGKAHVGKGPFVAMFAQANEGDTSPNVNGARCLDTGLPCDFVTSTCNNRNELCVAHGPGRNMFESTKVIGEMQYKKAKELFMSKGKQVMGQIQFVYENFNITSRTVKLSNGTQVKTCAAALGYSFAAGTTDGEGASFFQQGTKSGQESPLWNYLRNLITSPSEQLLDCQKPKAVLLPVGEMRFPYEWAPEIMPTQILEIGDILIVGLPAEFTTMAGRRIRRDIEIEFEEKGRKVHVILAGLVNTYSNYVTTEEEYQLQRYEAGATLFGPYTLAAYREQFKYLAQSLSAREQVDFGPEFPNFLKSQITLKPGVIFDTPLSDHFGQVITDALDSYYAGSRVKVRFSGANPRNNMRLESTFLTVEKRSDNDAQWEIIATDASWDTMFIWYRNSTFLGTSEVTIIWDIPKDAEPGWYRISYFGDSKNLFQMIGNFSGLTKEFQVRPLSELQNKFNTFVIDFTSTPIK